MSELVFSGRTALITGGTRGIGRAAALRLAREGAKVAANYVSNTEKAEQTVSDLEATGAARKRIDGYPPSSPSMALFRGGEAVLVLERRDIEGRVAQDIASDLMRAFDQYCASPTGA